ncbi:TadE/TadG family type IV pilus assembly protein [Granulicella sibirica]|uniref:TadE/TadG family type IV pilus assembly protein n=1 Tax=Granulicella sibirica TaxID=2479048 RepID=UPI001375DFAB|nr:TadE family protein [Granulicella sibirica]
MPITSFGCEEDGAAALETAIGFMLIFTCILGIIECCMMVYTYSVYADAARHGMRYATLHGFDSATCSGPTAGCGDPTASNVISDVTTYAARYAAPASSITVAVLYPDIGGCIAQSRVLVTVSYVYQPLFRFPGTATSFQISSQGRILY